MQRTALVVGAAGGIGLEVVKSLLAAHYDVIATVLNEQEARQLQSGAGTLRETIELDLADADNVQRVLSARVGELDAVVVCAAIGPYGPLEIAPLSMLRKTFEINTVSDVAVYQACMPLLRARQGRFVFVSSFAGRIGLPGLGHYVASKFALEGLCDVMRREAKPWGVDVIVVEPGGIKTPMVSGQINSVAHARAALTPAQAELYGSMYDTFAKLFNLGWQTGLEPAVAAAQIVAIVQDAAPLPRYQIGEDAQYLCNVAAKQADQEQDAIVAGFIAQAK